MNKVTYVQYIMFNYKLKLRITTLLYTQGRLYRCKKRQVLGGGKALSSGRLPFNQVSIAYLPIWWRQCKVHTFTPNLRLPSI